MKREEKNRQSRQKIMDCALREFAEQGYGLGSVNSICRAGDISKGVLYHYFKDRDEIYLMCVQECFDALSCFLRKRFEEARTNRLQEYFDARYAFFDEYPLYQRLFCDAVISPPQHLEKEIAAIREDFDQLNLSVLTELLSKVTLRRDVTTEQVIEIFRLFQDFVNARYQMTPLSELDMKQHEETARRSLDILLYGVVERRADHEQ